jgi:hypothetical protein
MATGVRGGSNRSIKIEQEGVRGVRGGSEGSEPFDQDWTGKSQTRMDERLRVALTGGTGHQAHVREAVSRGPGRSI